MLLFGDVEVGVVVWVIVGVEIVVKYFFMFGFIGLFKVVININGMIIVMEVMVCDCYCFLIK